MVDLLATVDRRTQSAFVEDVSADNLRADAGEAPHITCRPDKRTDTVPVAFEKPNEVSAEMTTRADDEGGHGRGTVRSAT
jgi:hypothetical protein